jgi:hypothetical protein
MNRPRHPVRSPRSAGRRGWLRALCGAAVGAALVVPRVTAAADAPAPLELDYVAFLDTGAESARIGSAHLVFRTEGARYLLTLAIRSPLAALTYESAGLIDAEGLHPRRYREVRKVLVRPPRERVVLFDEAGGPSEPDERAQPAERLAIPRGAQDRISVLVHVGLLAREQPRRVEAGSEWPLRFATFDSVERTRLAFGPSETIDVDGERVHATRVRRLAAEAGATSIDFWLADDATRTPVVLRFEDDGRVLRFVMRKR